MESWISAWLPVLVPAGLGLAVLIAFGIHTSRTMAAVSRPTTGPRIDRAGRTASALVLVDMQADFTRRKGKGAYSEVDRRRVVAEVNALVADAHRRGEPVISLRHVWNNWAIRLVVRLLLGGAGNAGRPGLALDPDLSVGEVIDIVKHRGDGFSAPELEACLARLNVGHLRIVGLDACHCVQLTARGALARGYTVEILDEGVLASAPSEWQALQSDLSRQGIRITAQPAA